MSYECGECGKNSVDKYGEWCNECQQRAQWEREESDARWYASSALCQKCNNPDGPDPNDECSAYNMPLWMVKRKRKCKRFVPYDFSKEKSYFWEDY